MTVNNRLCKVWLRIPGGPAGTTVSAELNVIRLINRPDQAFSLTENGAWTKYWAGRRTAVNRAKSVGCDFVAYTTAWPLRCIMLEL